MHYRHVSFLTPETQGRWITVKIKIYITAVNQIRKKTQSDVSDDPGFPWNAQKIQTQMYFVHSPTHSAIQQSDPSTCLVALLCLAPCFENSVLWIAGVLSDTCALSDSYLLPTVCYHSSSWKSSSGKRKQQLHSIRMMLVCVCVCCHVHTVHIFVPLPITSWPSGSENNDTPFQLSWGNIFSVHAWRNMLCYAFAGCVYLYVVFNLLVLCMFIC